MKKDLLAEVEAEIALACAETGRKISEVKLIAVSKTKSWEEIADFLTLGQVDFGENYVQEATAKIAEAHAWRSLHHRTAEPRWHFIGTLQSNKAKFIPGNFTLFHALDSESVARRLDRSAAVRALVQECLVEVNLDGESTKGGVAPADLPKFLTTISSLPNLTVTGLMCIPAAGNSRGKFAQLRELMAAANKQGCYPSPLKELSMGMSADFADAIREGATMVRVGTRLFGERQ